MSKKNNNIEGPATQAPTTPEAEQSAANISTAGETTLPGTAETVAASQSEQPTASISPDTENETPAQAQETDKTAPASGTLPAGYLLTGYYHGEGKGRYTDPALVDQAEEIGKALAAGKVTPTVFNRLLRTLKVAQKLPFEAQAGAFKKVLTQITDLENQKKSPPMLREVVERNRVAVQTEADYAACLDHFRDIGIYLVAQAASAGT